ncbi:hypothetical protein TEU_01845 [Thermococcus eurythermalis]|uniref:Uncharacterized protein n=1 Tax=Thermococcus eurythermalis TaxID=1505907 RepID=A0A097QRS4_9EURY|nr:hypothetical protein [Thermococcus eurythermalis]AIU69181.1 hypothetical protein TEU_01845 [Thermococcus eurythermalis]
MPFQEFKFAGKHLKVEIGPPPHGLLPECFFGFFSVITVDGEPLFGEVIGGHIEYDECGLEIAIELMQAILCLLSPRMSLNPHCAKCLNPPAERKCEHFLSRRKEIPDAAYCARIGRNYYLFTIENGMFVVYYKINEHRAVGDIEVFVPVEKVLRLSFREFAEDIIDMAENFWNYLLSNLEDINSFLVSSGCEEWMITEKELGKYKSLLTTLKSIYSEKTNLR